MTCDCGAPVTFRGASVCASCAWLDGTTPAEQRLISALRACGGRATAAALKLESELPERTLRRTLARLRALGRVATETDADDDGRAEHRLVATANG